MSASPAALPTTPLEHPAQDYTLLRSEGIRHLERLAGESWTDFNTHDPGITILEQLCFALTDLAYRIDYEIPDLLVGKQGESPYQSLFSPDEILPCRPVTLDDLRKLVIDVEGVKNAWVEPLNQPPLPLYYHEGRQELSLTGEQQSTDPVYLKGLYRVLIEKSDLEDIDGGIVVQAVTNRLHSNRGLSEDFIRIRLLEPQLIRLNLRVEVGPVEDAAETLSAIFNRLEQYISPSIPTTTLAQELSAGKTLDEIFQGPLLHNGFIDDETLRRSDRKQTLHSSDLINEIMGLPDVRVVQQIKLISDEKEEQWSLTLDPEKSPRLDLNRSSITLLRGELTVAENTQKIRERYQQKQRESAISRSPAWSKSDLMPPARRNRQVGKYHSVQHQFPADYGIGPKGLPGTASTQRKAQARQLKAYLMFFDQLLADSFAQLSQTGKLFSFYDDSTESYFTQLPDDPDLKLEEILNKDTESQVQKLRQIGRELFDTDSEPGRRNRFLNHLLARFAEQFTDYSLMRYKLEQGLGQKTAAGLMRDKQAFLRRYPVISSGRGGACNYLSAEDKENRSGLERRIQLKLGLNDEHRFYLIEHTLLRPLEGDKQQQPPLLADARQKAPYSLQISLIFPSWPTRYKAADFRRLVEKTVREETPAHLIPYIHWLGNTAMQKLQTAYHTWREQLQHAHGPQIPLRAARDRLIDLLGFAATYPIQDLKVHNERLTVPFNSPAKIPVSDSQHDVIYHLYDPTGREPLDPPISIPGNGKTIILETPKIRENITYRIYAEKIDSKRGALLHSSAPVKVGLDLTLKARIQGADLLDPTVDTPADTAPRLINYAAGTQVVIDDSQEGVDYTLVHTPTGSPRQQTLSPAVRGTGGGITLSSKAILEDTELHIQASKKINAGSTEKAQLEIMLPLKIRANPSPVVTVEPQPIIKYADGAVIKLGHTQKSTRYRLFIRAIPDRDILHTHTAGEKIITVDVKNEPQVEVRRPPYALNWTTPNGFIPVTEEAAQGTGGLLRLNIAPEQLPHDSLLLVQAEKSHQTADGVIIPSAIALEQAAVVLTEPNPEPELKLSLPITGNRTQGQLKIEAGQPGIFYYFRTKANGGKLKLPAYFHQHDGRENKGIDQLRIGVDMAVARDHPVEPADLGKAPPPLPILDTVALKTDLTLYIQARKAQTGVAVALKKSASIPAAPDIHPESAEVESGKTARIIVVAARKGERYQLTLDGNEVKRARNGNNEDLVFITEAVTQDSRFEMLITQPADKGIPVTRRVPIEVTVTPST